MSPRSAVGGEIEQGRQQHSEAVRAETSQRLSCILENSVDSVKLPQ